MLLASLVGQDNNSSATTSSAQQQQNAPKMSPKSNPSHVPHLTATESSSGSTGGDTTAVSLANVDQLSTTSTAPLANLDPTLATSTCSR